jgi:intergrase/recombinase
VEQRAAIKFCVQLYEITMEIFEMLKGACDEKCLSRTSVLQWHKRHIETQKVRMQKSWVIKMFTTFLDAKGIIRHEFMDRLDKQSTKFTLRIY